MEKRPGKVKTREGKDPDYTGLPRCVISPGLALNYARKQTLRKFWIDQVEDNI